MADPTDLAQEAEKLTRMLRSVRGVGELEDDVDWYAKLRQWRQSNPDVPLNGLEIALQRVGQASELSPEELDKLNGLRAAIQTLRTQEWVMRDSGQRCPICGVPVRAFMQWFPGTEQRYYFNVDGPDPCSRLICQEISFDPALREKGPWGEGPCPKGWWENPPEEFKRKVDEVVAKLRAARNTPETPSTDEIDSVRFRKLEKQS